MLSSRLGVIAEGLFINEKGLISLGLVLFDLSNDSFLGEKLTVLIISFAFFSPASPQPTKSGIIDPLSCKEQSPLD